MTDPWIARMDDALRAIPEFEALVRARFLQDRPGSAGMESQMWLNCVGGEESPHPVWRQKHTKECRGLMLALRDRHGDPNAPQTFWFMLLIGDRFELMEGLTPRMAERIGQLHREYASHDLAEAAMWRPLLET